MKYYFIHNGITFPCDTKEIFVNALCVYLDGEHHYDGELEAFVDGEIVTVKKIKGVWVFSTARQGEIWRGLYAYYENNNFVEVKIREVI